MITFEKDGMVKYVDDASSLIDVLISQGWTSEEESLGEVEVVGKKRGRKPKE